MSVAGLGEIAGQLLRRATVLLWDNRKCEATIASRDSRRDLAALRIVASDLPAVSVADSSQVVGALSTGVIHAVGPLRGIGRGPRLVRFKFLRGDCQSIRRVTARFGEPLVSGSGIAA